MGTAVLVEPDDMKALCDRLVALEGAESLDKAEVQDCIKQFNADNPVVIPDQRICTGPFVRCNTRTGWWNTYSNVGGTINWSASYNNTGNVPTTLGDWETVGNGVVVAPDCVTDIHVHGDLGNHLFYMRNTRMYYWLDVRLLINGAQVLLETYDKYVYQDERINNATADEPLQYETLPISAATLHRLNVPASATIELQARPRYRTVGAGDANYFRTIAGLRSQTSVVFTPRTIVTGRV